MLAYLRQGSELSQRYGALCEELSVDRADPRFQSMPDIDAAPDCGMRS